MENYRRSVDHIDKLASRRSRGEETASRKLPSLTVDGLILRDGKENREVLLIKRLNEPFQGRWALPGGFVDYGENTQEAVLREVFEETGLNCTVLELVSVASDPGRDPRGHTISIIYRLQVMGDHIPKAGDDASEAGWFDTSDLPSMAFDHEDIIKSSL
ncbi:MAG: NUDIX hydrolase [Candidatus Thermoplasmatota archaeon]|nr:NUDIX hydrolase [Candidatus Thermoplasmatota archaeon]